VEQLRDDLVKMIVHDLRSPITALLMQLQMLREDLDGDAAQSVDDASASASRVNALATTLLDLVRLEEGKLPLKLASADLTAIASEVRRVMENLVSNGIKHTPRGGRLRIRLESGVSTVRVAVEDEGAGVPADLRDRIFEKFGAVEVRQNSSYHSVGLGLAFCRLAVEAHGGTIGVTDAVPHGSVFTVELPA
jgi:signal transduction histidine kinase